MRPPLTEGPATFVGGFIGALTAHRCLRGFEAVGHTASECQLWKRSRDLPYYCEESSISGSFAGGAGTADVFDLYEL